MMDRLLSIPRIIISFIICFIALLLPYRLRISFFKIVSELVHFPFKLFGWMAKFMLKQLRAGKTDEQ